jgi:deoxyribonuclease V
VVARGAARPTSRGLLALREGPLLEAALRALPERPDVLIANASGRDHPRRAGLALHFGTVLDCRAWESPTGRSWRAAPTPLRPGAATSPPLLDGAELARGLRTRAGARPIVVHSG